MIKVSFQSARAEGMEVRKLTVNGHDGLQVRVEAILQIDGDGAGGSGPLELEGLAGLDDELGVGERGLGVDDSSQGGDQECGELHGGW